MKLNSIVPNFSAETTQGPIDFYDWQNDSWIVLFSHPADFTPVAQRNWDDLPCILHTLRSETPKLLALSINELNDHIIWDIKSYCPDILGDFPYPIVADPDRRLAVLLGLIDEDNKDNPEEAHTIRALYVISPDHRLRLSMHYPTSTGRNVDEILRVIDSLQLVDRKPQVVKPANWTPGDKVMIVPSVKEEDLPNLFPKGVERVSMPSGKVYVRTTTVY